MESPPDYPTRRRTRRWNRKLLTYILGFSFVGACQEDQSCSSLTDGDQAYEPPSSIEVSPSSDTLFALGPAGAITLRAIGPAAGAHRWTTFPNQSTARIQSTNNVGSAETSAVIEGLRSGHIVVRVSDANSHWTTGSASLKIAPPDSVAFDPAAVSLGGLGASQTVSFSVVDFELNPSPGSWVYTWTLSNPSVATAVATGPASVNITSTGGGTATLTVTETTTGLQGSTRVNVTGVGS